MKNGQIEKNEKVKENKIIKIIRNFLAFIFIMIGISGILSLQIALVDIGFVIFGMTLSPTFYELLKLNKYKYVSIILPIVILIICICIPNITIYGSNYSEMDMIENMNVNIY